MKRFITLLLLFILLISCGSTVMADTDRFSHLLLLNSWTDDTFSDIDGSNWFYDDLSAAYRMGLINGIGGGKFDPDGTVTVAQAVKMAACISKLFYTASTDFPSGDPWWRSYVDYALESDIIRQEFDDYSRPVTRREFAVMLSHTLKGSIFSPINTVENGSIPDVAYSDSGAGSIYTLYRAGVLTGDRSGCFHPDDSITRAEAAAVISRVMLESRRKNITLTAPEKPVLSGEEIYAKCTPAVFYIEMYDAEGNRTGNASGFFIDGNGTGVTCWHVLEMGVSARIAVASTGGIYDVAGVYDYDAEHDWALIKVDGEGFDYLDIGDAKTNVGGASVYALGSPLGLQNTITQGLICNPTRVEDDTRYILFSAAISSGSSGGALISKYGDVIGITAATYVYGQNLNLAVNISYIDLAHRSTVTPLKDVKAAAHIKGAA